MPTEQFIRKKAIGELEKKGWICWYPKKVRWQETDIFGCYDLICCHKDWVVPLFVQLTTLPNRSARRKKIRTFMEKVGMELWSELWSYDGKKKRFAKERVSLAAKEKI